MRASEYPLGSRRPPDGRTPAPAGAELAGYGLLDSRAGLQRPPSDGAEASRRQRSDTERRQAPRRAQVTLGERQQGRAEQPENTRNGSSLTTIPKKKLSVPNGHGCGSGLNAKNVPRATNATDHKYPTGTVTFARPASSRSQSSVPRAYPVNARSTRRLGPDVDGAELSPAPPRATTPHQAVTFRPAQAGQYLASIHRSERDPQVGWPDRMSGLGRRSLGGVSWRWGRLVGGGGAS